MGSKSISGNPGKMRPLISVITGNDWFPQLTVTYIPFPGIAQLGLSVVEYVITGPLRCLVTT